MNPIVKIGWKQTSVDSDPATDADLAEHFSSHHAILLRNAIEPDFHEKLAKLWTEGRFLPHNVPRLGDRTVEYPGFAGHLLRTALMRSPLPSWLGRVTACGPFHQIIGDVTQFSATSNHQLDWHTDRGENETRRLAITVNLGSEPYEGGEFEMRSRQSSDLLLRHRHSETGMVLLFSGHARIAPPGITGHQGRAPNCFLRMVPESRRAPQ